MKRFITHSRRAFMGAAAGFCVHPNPIQAQEEKGRPYYVSFGVEIPTRDGTRLTATIVRPADQKPAPLVLTITPYGRDGYYPISTFFAKRGYAAAAVDVRGRGDSGGVFEPYVHDGDDGFDIVEWLAKQPYCDGSVVMRGNSYTGTVQWLVAARRPPALKTIVPGGSNYPGLTQPSFLGVELPYELQWYSTVVGRARNTNLNQDRAYWNGLEEELASGKIAFPDYAREAGLPADYWKTIVAHPVLDDHWKSINPTEAQLASVNIPTLSLSGVYDGAQDGTIYHLDKLQSANPAAKSNSYLLIGPWSHEGVSFPEHQLGGVTFGPASDMERNGIALAWFDWVLGRAGRPTFLKDRFTGYIIGEDRWIGSKDIDATRQLSFTLAAGDRPVGKLVPGNRHTPGVSPATFVYDPTRKALNWRYMQGDGSRKDFLINDPLPQLLDGQGLIFESEPTSRAFVIAGRPQFVINARIDTPDTDLMVLLYEVGEDGTSVSLCGTVLRARYRNGYENPQPIEPNKDTDYHLHLPWIGKKIQAGKKLRVIVTSAGISVGILRNKNTGGAVEMESLKDSRVAHISVAMDGRSEMRLPIIESVDP